MTREIDRLQSQIDQLKRRLKATATRGVVTLTSDKEKTQRFQMSLMDGDSDEGIEHFQPQGLSFATEPGAEGVCIAIGADQEHLIALCANDPAKRPTAAKPGTGGLYTKKAWRVFIDTSDVVHIGAETGAQFIAQAKKTNDELDETRKRLDDLTTALNTLRTDFTTFGGHTHIVATAMGPATAAPTVPPLVPVAPIQPLLGASKSVAATKGKVT